MWGTCLLAVPQAAIAAALSGHQPPLIACSLGFHGARVWVPAVHADMYCTWHTAVSPNFREGFTERPSLCLTAARVFQTPWSVLGVLSSTVFAVVRLGSMHTRVAHVWRRVYTSQQCSRACQQVKHPAKVASAPVCLPFLWHCGLLNSVDINGFYTQAARRPLPKCPCGQICGRAQELPATTHPVLRGCQGISTGSGDVCVGLCL